MYTGICEERIRCTASEFQLHIIRSYRCLMLQDWNKIELDQTSDTLCPLWTHDQPMALKHREEVVGKRFLALRTPSKSSGLVESDFTIDFLTTESNWIRGVVRASTEKDISAQETQVWTEWDLLTLILANMVMIMIVIIYFYYLYYSSSSLNLQTTILV